jgi:tRNA (guanine9-N1)-methyltransferase
MFALMASLPVMLTDKERRSLRSQIGHMYGHMRRVDRPCHLWIASLDDSMRQLIFHIDNANTWPIHYRSETVLELFPLDKHRVVYLSPDATDLLEDVTADTVYVIGGIVDRNRLKNCTATRLARLVSRRHDCQFSRRCSCKMNNSLNVNHVYEILQTQSATHDWRQTFESACQSASL